MRGVRLNSWQRVGIALSVLWVIVGAWLAQRVVFDPVRAGYSKCMSLGVGQSICKAELGKGIARRKERLPGAIGVFALAPISVAWLLTYVIVWTVRWRVPAALELGGRLEEGFVENERKPKRKGADCQSMQAYIDEPKAARAPMPLVGAREQYLAALRRLPKDARIAELESLREQLED